MGGGTGKAGKIQRFIKHSPLSLCPQQGKTDSPAGKQITYPTCTEEEWPCCLGQPGKYFHRS